MLHIFNFVMPTLSLVGVSAANVSLCLCLLCVFVRMCVGLCVLACVLCRSGCPLLMKSLTDCLRPWTMPAQVSDQRDDVCILSPSNHAGTFVDSLSMETVLWKP